MKENVLFLMPFPLTIQRLSALRHTIAPNHCKRGWRFQRNPVTTATGFIGC